MSERASERERAARPPARPLHACVRPAHTVRSLPSQSFPPAWQSDQSGQFYFPTRDTWVGTLLTIEPRAYLPDPPLPPDLRNPTNCSYFASGPCTRLSLAPIPPLSTPFATNLQPIPQQDDAQHYSAPRSPLPSAASPTGPYNQSWLCATYQWIDSTVEKRCCACGGGVATGPSPPAPPAAPSPPLPPCHNVDITSLDNGRQSDWLLYDDLATGKAMYFEQHGCEWFDSAEAPADACEK